MINRRTLLTRASSVAVTAALPSTVFAATNRGAELNAIFDGIVQDYMARSPELLTGLGMDKGDYASAKGKLADRSLAARVQDRADNARHLAKMRAFDHRSLSGMDAVNYDTVIFEMQVTEEANRLTSYSDSGASEPYAVSQLTGAYQFIPDFLDSQHSIETAADADAYLSRLEAFATVLDQESEVVRRDVGAGLTPPDFVLERTLGQMNGLRLASAETTVLVQSLVRRAKAKGLSDHYGAAASKIYQDRIQPALNRQADLIASLQPKAVHDAGVWRLPEGEAYYAAALKSSTTTSLSPDEIHQMGLDQAADLTAQIDTILKAQGMSKGTVGERIRALYTDPQFLYPNTDTDKERLLEELNRQTEAVQALLPQYFGILPKAKVEIRRVPSYIEAGAPGGYYSAPSMDGTRPGAYYINLRDTAENPTWTLPTLTHHEASPGHHFQIALQQEAPLPLIRQLGGFSAYVEGWALYAEQLADEMGLYAKDPFGKIGYLQSALFRACRLVVDTGMHHKRWSREKAIDWMATTDGDVVSGVTTEIERYCVWPGQACSYKVGQTVWSKLRSEAKEALGERFDIRQFHDIGLQAGAMPLTVLERVIRDYVAGKKV
jgi:uncharacterized protein (DUF885 family)